MELTSRIQPLIGHAVAPYALRVLSHLTRAKNLIDDPMTWTARGHVIQCRNRLGIAGGVDKNGTQIKSWRHFGAGFVEIGTVTPRPQTANPGWILGRDSKTQTLWNRMGFPGPGGSAVLENLIEWRRREHPNGPGERFPVLVNIGKNRDTSLEQASSDYTSLIELFSSAKPQGKAVCEGFVINISSPNTSGLRDLFQRERLRSFLEPIALALGHHSVPGLLKLSPDLDRESLANAVRVACDLGLDGFITTNTTAARDAKSIFPPEGGVSGAALTERSRECLMRLIETLGDERRGKLIISAGGVLSREEYERRRELGADLVEVYSALAFHGPWFFERILASPKS